MVLIDEETNTTFFPFMSDFDRNWKGQSVIEATVFMLLFVVAVSGNTLILAAMCKDIRLRTVPFMFIGNLAVTDILFSMASPFLAITRLSGNWILGSIMCKFVGFLSISLAMCSLSTLVLISIDRYHGIKNHASWITKQQVSIVLIITWILSAVLSTPMFIQRNVKSFVSNNVTFTICTNQWQLFSQFYFQTYLRLLSLACFITPLITMLVMYLKLGRLIRDVTMRVESGRVRSNHRTRGQLRLVKMFTVIVILYFIMYLPYTVTVALRYRIRISSTVHAAVVMLTMSTTCYNPIIYGYFNKLLRKRVRIMLCGK